MPIFKIHHLTKYEYDRKVQASMNEIKIFPYACREQELLQHDLFITSHPDIQTYVDYWGNKAGTFSVLAAHSELVIDSRLVVRTTGSTELTPSGSVSTLESLQNETTNELALLELAIASMIERTGEIQQIVDEVCKATRNVAVIIKNCCEYIFTNFNYIKGITNVETTVDELLLHKAGVCQDFAHLMLQVLRTIGIPCRYVSGYICPNKNGMRGQGATHAWIEAWIPKYGWTGIDPTNNVWVTNEHVKLSVGRNFYDCSPVKGTFKGPAIQKLSVYVSVGYEDGQMFEEMNNVQLAAHEQNQIAALEASEMQQQ